MNEGTCKFCRETAMLCNSHALPHSIFKSIHRKNNGNAISIVDDDTTPNHLSSDSWAEKALCLQCEKYFNDQYDSFGLSVLRGTKVQTSKELQSVLFRQLESSRLKMFFLSILWRMAVSDHIVYSNISLSEEQESELRLALKNRHALPINKFMVLLSKSRDSTPENGFTNKNLREFIISPFTRSYKDCTTVNMVCLGFFVEIILYTNLSTIFNQPGALIESNSIDLHVPYVEFLEIPEVMQALVNGYSKIIN